MKRIIPLLILTLIIILPIEVKALSVDKNNLTIDKGKSETVTLTATVEEEVTEIDFTLVYTTYDIPAYYNIASGLTDNNPNGVAHKIVLSEPTTGTITLGTVKIDVVNNPSDKTGAINIHSAKAITSSGETINLTAQTINVTIGVEQTENNEEETPTENTTVNEPKEDKKEETKQEEPKTTDKKDEEKDTETKETNLLLEKIESDIVKIELKDGIYEYTVNIKDDIEELDLNPVTKDKKYKVEISSQKISELTDNQIIITVKNGEEKEEYKIKVNTMQVEEIEIDNSEFESTYKYKGKWILLIVILSATLFVGLLLSKKNR